MVTIFRFRVILCLSFSLSPSCSHCDKLPITLCSSVLTGLKFDLRLYVLVTSVKPLRAYLYQNGLARICTNAYEPPTSENMDDKFMHLTNFSVNNQNVNFEKNVDAEETNVGNKWDLSALWAYLKAQGIPAISVTSR